ncbi:MAG: hypothetical protein JWO97_3906, partial [Acidobacteria bacterium]|nr:hypothetical protein [Acidobacteriota bacterium]
MMAASTSAKREVCMLPDKTFE